MIYGTENYAERERAAWQAGDYERAELLGLAGELDAKITEAEALRDIVLGIDARITETPWRTGKKADLVALIEGIREELRELDKTP